MLLHWGIVEPAGPTEDLAAIRFSSHVRIRSIRVFPTGSRPFAQQPDIVASTEPSAFYLEVFFNAQPLTSSDGKQKPKPTNALVPAILAYAGGEVEFTVDIGAEFSTRLIIIRGNFKSLSVAIYGDIVAELSTADTYEPSKLPQLEHIRLSPALDPSNALEPLKLAQSLLTMMPDAPPLPLLIRLMFCLKPSNEDWNEPGFPHLYADIEEDYGEFDLQRAVDITTRPVPDTTDEDTLRSFAERVASCLGVMDDDQAYFIAKLLSQCSSQQPMLVRFLLGTIDIGQILTVRNLEKSTLALLLDAAANPDVARHLNSDHVFRSLNLLRTEHGAETATRKLANKLIDRIRGWDAIEDALTNAQADFRVATATIKDLTSDESSFGVFMESMIIHETIVNRLAENPIPSQLLSPLPDMWDKTTALVTHEEFVAFLRAFIGVAAVVAVYAWSDSVPDKNCRERSLAILRLWQNVNGYQQIVDHLLLLRQMTFRLEYMLPLEDDEPSQAAIDAEHILSKLAWQTHSMLHADFVKVMHSIQPPLTYITEHDMNTFQDAANMVDGGLTSAVKMILSPPPERADAAFLLKLRVALAIVARELQEDPEAELRLLEVVWDEGHSDLPIYLTRQLSRLTDDLLLRFTLSVPLRHPQEDTARLFEAADQCLTLIIRLLPAYPLSMRHLTMLAHTTADLFVCTDSSDTVYTQGSRACSLASTTRQSCINFMTSFVSPAENNTRIQDTTVVLRALLKHAIDPKDHDAVHHITQVFWLFDHALPLRPSKTWPSSNWFPLVFTSLLSDLRIFYHALEADNKAHLIKRLHALDEGVPVVGISEWLLLEEINRLSDAANAYADPDADDDRQRIRRWQIISSLNVLSALTQSSSSSSGWCMAAFTGEQEAAASLTKCLITLADRNLYHPALGDIALELIAQPPDFAPELSKAILRIIVTAARAGLLTAFDATSHNIGQIATLGPAFLSYDVASALENVAIMLRNGQMASPELAASVHRILAFSGTLQSSLSPVSLAMTKSSLDELFNFMAAALPPDLSATLEVLRTTVEASEDVQALLPPIELTGAVELPLGKWEDLLSPSIPTPQTPPPQTSQSADMLGLVAISPPNALFRSPEVKGLTKTYSNNDFRQLRQSSAVRQNTSRLPSMHVDDFELAGPSSSPTTLPTKHLADASGLPVLPMMLDTMQAIPPFVRPQ